MLRRTIQELEPTDERAVIINVETKLVTTLAVMSALKYSGMNVLLIDCESKDGSLEYFSDLMKSYDFDLLPAPLQRHGKTLDWVFTNIPAKKVLLIDSDVEILGPEIIRELKRLIDNPAVFGTGFVHSPQWLTEPSGLGNEVGYYQERMWIPFTFLKVAYIQDALERNYSFADRIFYNDFAPSQRIAKILYQRLHFRIFRNSRLLWLNLFKQAFNGLKPSYVYYDTGADIFQYLKYQRGYDFVGLPARLHTPYVTHFHGVTRLRQSPLDKNGTELKTIAIQVQKRLKDVYAIDLPT